MKRALVLTCLVLASMSTAALLAQSTADKPPTEKSPAQNSVLANQELMGELAEIKAQLEKQDKTLGKIQKDVNPGFVKIVAQELAVDFVKDLLQPDSLKHFAGLLASGLSILIGIVKLGYWIWKWREWSNPWNKVSNGVIALCLIVVGGLLLLTQRQTKIETYNSAPTEKLQKLTGVVEQLSHDLKAAGITPVPAAIVSEQLASLRADIRRVDEKVSQSSARTEAWQQSIVGKLGGGFQSLFLFITMVLVGFCAIRLLKGARRSEDSGGVPTK